MTTITLDDLGDSLNATVDGIEFTADKASREWGLRPDDNAEALKSAAAAAGIAPDQFWPHYEPILNRAAGWG